MFKIYKILILILFLTLPLSTNSHVQHYKNLNRIGYGKGYYDRVLKKINKIKKKAIFIGIAFSFQKSIKVPTNKHDVKLDYIFTERGIISSKLLLIYENFISWRCCRTVRQKSNI